MSFQEKLNHVIPGGAHTYSRGHDQYPSNAPQILTHGKGAYVWDPDGNKFLDYGMGLRAVTLGYANERVSAAAIREIEKGNNLTRASTVELEAAELIVDLIPSAEMVKFAKNGSNVTSAAARIARAYTGKHYICVPRQHPFFSFDDWFIGTTPVQRGIPDQHSASSLVFDYNDISSLQKLFDEYPDQIAAVMLEPATTITPCPSACTSTLTYDSNCGSCANVKNNFLHQVQSLCRKNNALFILDEMITGFRWALEGAQYYFGLEPDLSTFGKGMANGFSVAAVVGRRDIMEVGSIENIGAERTFLLSTTHGGEMCGLGAFIETVSVYREENVCRHLWQHGEKLRDGLNSIAQKHGIANHFSMDGPAISLNYVTKNTNGELCPKFRTLFAQEMIRNNVMMPWVAVSHSHGDKELDITLSAAEASMRIYAQALEEGIEKYLVGPEVKPVFRKYN